ncbi:Predicted nucleic acid-binding protein, contains Zn-ribbon domain (includes truncated derivatives) [Paramicrobacterium humi]|uniref:Predicted nucleic acid-binding protein, contains Zn-ribbon domain (Includes truncated derivatives) n=1 Tax=Paramicrobacterium humi TaxID=640635 RepID=A0A1H4KEP2_9MICO|nr:DciA family protein [Microbacterium humi]SEB56961.1 Predicted nucleic acid-binding protein, contains Zn-ribbon domain (includes truncated derivatives) [Microbacterium humi]
MPEEEFETESSRVYHRLKAMFGGRTSGARRGKRRDSEGSSVPFGSGREPKGLGDVVSALTSQLGWDSPLAQSELILKWDEIAGADTAAHSEPLGIERGVLTVRCESTAWATQLRLMRVEIMNRIAVSFPDAGIDSIRFQGPNVPSFKRGPRSVQGRGVRDTYG